MNRVSKRNVILAALIGGFSGVVGQFVVDFFCWHSENGQTICEFLYATAEWEHKNEVLKKKYKIRISDHVHESRELLNRAVFLILLTERGEIASRTGLFAGFLAVTVALAISRKRKSASP